MVLVTLVKELASGPSDILPPNLLPTTNGEESTTDHWPLTTHLDGPRLMYESQTINSPAYNLLCYFLPVNGKEQKKEPNKAGLTPVYTLNGQVLSSWWHYQVLVLFFALTFNVSQCCSRIPCNSHLTAPGSFDMDGSSKVTFLTQHPRKLLPGSFCSGYFLCTRQRLAARTLRVGNIQQEREHHFRSHILPYLHYSWQM